MRRCAIIAMCRLVCQNRPALFTTPSVTGMKTDAKSSNKEEKTPISRYPTTNVKELPVHVQERMYNLDDKVGFIPNLFHALAHRPDEFKGYLELYDAITKNSKLKRSERELIGIAASAYNNCVYCVVSHSALHRLASRNPTLADEVAVNPSTSQLNPREKAIVDFTLAITRNETVTGEHLDRLAEHGIEREMAWDIVSFASLTGFINRMSNFLQIRPNSEFFTMGRGDN